MKRPVQVFNYVVRNNTNSLDIFIDGEIVDASTQEIYRNWFGDETSVSFKSIRDQIASSVATTINVYVNSPGGQVTDAMAIHDYLKELQNKGKTVNTYGRGIIASAATYILMAGGKPQMSKNSWFMIHNVSGYAWGDVNEVERQAGILRQFNNRIRDFYAEATGIRKEDITKMMNAETWMTAEEALTNGFIKEVGGQVEFTNAISASDWMYSNTAVLNAYNAAVTKPVADPAPADSIQQFILNQNDDMKKFFQNILDGLKNVKPAENATTTDIVNMIVSAMETPFTNIADEIETQIAEKVKEVETNVLNSLKKEYEDRIKDLETKNTELEQDIVNLKGGKTNVLDNGDAGPKPVGSFR
jgi:ATP-dependent Clp endopeptidase proteolytic subunit ClpP